MGWEDDAFVDSGSVGTLTPPAKSRGRRAELPTQGQPVSESEATTESASATQQPVPAAQIPYSPELQMKERGFRVPDWRVAEPPPHEEPKYRELEFEGTTYRFHPNHSQASIQRFFDKLTADRRKLTPEQAKGRSQPTDADAHTQEKQQTELSREGRAEWAKQLSGTDKDGKPVEVTVDQINPQSLSEVVRLRREKAAELAKQPNINPVALREYNEDTDAMDRDTKRMFNNETTLEYKQRMAVMRGADPKLEKPTESAVGRDSMVIAARIERELKDVMSRYKKFEDIPKDGQTYILNRIAQRQSLPGIPKGSFDPELAGPDGKLVKFVGKARLEKAVMPEFAKTSYAPAAMIGLGADWVSLGQRALGFNEAANTSIHMADAFEQVADQQAQGGLVPAFIERGARNVVRTVPSMVVAGQLAGPYGALGIAGVQEANRSITKGQDAGMSAGDIAKYAITQGVIEAGVGAVFQKFGWSGAEGAAAAKNVASKGLGQAMKRLGITTLQELPEEVITEIGHDFEDWNRGVDPNAMDIGNLAQTVADTIVATVMMSGAVSAPNVAGATLNGMARKQAKGAIDEFRAATTAINDNLSNPNVVGAWVKDNPELAASVAATDTPSRSQWEGEYGFPERSSAAQRKQFADAVRQQVGEGTATAPTGDTAPTTAPDVPATPPPLRGKRPLPQPPVPPSPTATQPEGPAGSSVTTTVETQETPAPTPTPTPVPATAKTPVTPAPVAETKPAIVKAPDPNTLSFGARKAYDWLRSAIDRRPQQSRTGDIKTDAAEFAKWIKKGFGEDNYSKYLKESGLTLEQTLADFQGVPLSEVAPVTQEATSAKPVEKTAPSDASGGARVETQVQPGTVDEGREGVRGRGQEAGQVSKQEVKAVTPPPLKQKTPPPLKTKPHPVETYLSDISDDELTIRAKNWGIEATDRAGIVEALKADPELSKFVEDTLADEVAREPGDTVLKEIAETPLGKKVRETLNDVYKQTGSGVVQVQRPSDPWAVEAENFARRVTKKVGGKTPTVVWYAGAKQRTGHRGFAKDGVIYMNADTEGENIFWNTISHEVSHALGLDRGIDLSEETLSDQSDEYLELYRTQFGDDAAEKLANDPERLKGEATAHFIGKLFQDPEFRAQLQQSDPSLWQRIVEVVRKLFERAGLMQTTNPDIAKVRDAFFGTVGQEITPERIKSGAVTVEDEQRMVEEMNPDLMFAPRELEKAQKSTAAWIRKTFGKDSVKSMMAQVFDRKGMNKLIKHLLDNIESYPNLETPGSFVKNADPTYKMTVDLLGACTRMLRALAIRKYINQQHPNASAELLRSVENELNKKGYALTCLYCYAFTRRMIALDKLKIYRDALNAGTFQEVYDGMSSTTKNNLKSDPARVERMKEEFRQAQEEAQANPGWEQDLENIPEMLQVKTMSKYPKQGRFSPSLEEFEQKYPKIAKARQWATDPGNFKVTQTTHAITKQILNISDKDINFLKLFGGLRWQSSVDFFEMLTLDYVLGVQHMELKGLPGHLYTKELALALLMNGNGMKINMSAAPLITDGKVQWEKGPDGELRPKLDQGIGSVSWDEVEQAMKVDPKHTGVMMLGLNHEVVRWAITSKSKYAKYCIPWHASGMKSIIREMFVNVKSATDYKQAHEVLKTWDSIESVPEKFRSVVVEHKGKFVVDLLQAGKIDPKYQQIADYYRTRGETAKTGAEKTAYIKELKEDPNIPPSFIIDQANGTSDAAATKAYLKLCEDLGMHPVHYTDLINESNPLTNESGRRLSVTSKDTPFYWRLKKHYARTDTEFAPPKSSKINYDYAVELSEKFESSEVARQFREGKTSYLEAYQNRQLSEQEMADAEEAYQKHANSDNPLRDALKSLPVIQDGPSFALKPYTGDIQFALKPSSISIDPNSLSKEVLSRMSANLKKQGYDSRGADDVRDRLINGHILKDGMLTHPDWIEAYEVATASVAKRKQTKASKAEVKDQYPHIRWDRIRELGTTDNPSEAGYFTPTGSMIDLSGKREGGSPGYRSLDHREAGGTAGMLELMASGYIRFQSGIGGFDISKAPTLSQERMMAKIIQSRRGEVMVDLWDGLGEWDDHQDMYRMPKRRWAKIYNAGTNPAFVLKDIRDFFAGKEMPPEEELSFALRPGQSKLDALDEFIRQRNERRAAATRLEAPKLGTIDTTSVKKAVIDDLRQMAGLPAMKAITPQTVQDWADAAERMLKDDPLAADRLLTELNTKPRALDEVQVMVLQYKYRQLANELEPFQKAYFDAVKSGDKELVKHAARQLQLARGEMSYFESTVRPSGTTWGRAGRAMQEMLKKDFSRVVLLRRAQEWNNGQPLNEKQTAEMERMAAKITDVEGRLATVEAENEVLRAEKASKQQHEEAVKEGKATRSRKKSSQRVAVEKKINDAWGELKKAFGLPADKGNVSYSLRGDQTDTPAFKRWFGKSKVVDKDGKPLVVYHGTAKSFNRFSLNVERNTNMPNDAQGFYFTKSADDAASYATDDYGDTADGANLMPVFLRIENPFVVKSGDIKNHPAYISRERLAKLERDGFDGIVYGDGTEYVAFKPTQIKSATGNRGTFDPNDARINYSLAPDEQSQLAPAVKVASAYIESGVTHFPEFFAQVRKQLGDQASERLFRKAWDTALEASEVEQVEFDTEDEDYRRQLTREARKIQRTLVEAGITDRATVIETVHQSIKEIVPEFSRRDAMDALSAYGQYSEPNPEEIATTIRHMNAEILKLSQMDQLAKAIARAEVLRAEGLSEQQIGDRLQEEGLFVKPTGPQRDAPTDTVRELTAKYNELKKSVPAPSTKRAGQLSTAQGAVERFLLNRLRDVRAEIDADERIVKDKRTTPDTTKARMLRAELDALMKIHKEHFPRRAMTPEERLKASEKAGQRLLAWMQEQEKAGFPIPEPAAPPLTSAALEATRKQIADLRAKRDAAQKEGKRVAALDKQIAELQSRLAPGGNIAPKASRTAYTTPMIEERIARRRELQATLEARRDAEMPELKEARQRKAYEANLNRRIAALQRTLAEGDFSPKAKKEPRILSPNEQKLKLELEKLKSEVWRKMAEYHIAHLKGLAWTGDKIRELSHLSRAIWTSFDFSALGRQGGLVAISHPKFAKNALWGTIKSIAETYDSDAARALLKLERPTLADLKKFLSTIDTAQAEFNFHERLKSGTDGEFRTRSGLELTSSQEAARSQEELMQGRWAKYVPGVSLSGHLYSMILNKLRADLFDSMVANLARNGEVTVEEGKLIADFVNVTTGRGGWKKLQSHTETLNMVFFATRWAVSRFQYLAQPLYVPFKGGIKANWRVKREILAEMSRTMGALGTVLGAVAIAAALGYDDDDPNKPTIELDPRSSDFLKIRIGETRYDFTAGLSQAATFIARNLAQSTKSSITGKVKKFGEGYPAESTYTQILKFGRGKLAPVPGNVATILDNWENPVGEKQTALGMATGLFIPLTFREMWSGMQTQGIPKELTDRFIGASGAGVNTYGPRTTFLKSTPEEQQKLFDKDLENMEWNDPNPPYSDLLAPQQMEEVAKRRVEKQENLIYQAAEPVPDRSHYQSEASYQAAVKQHDEAVESFREMAQTVPLDIARQMLIRHYTRPAPGKSVGRKIEKDSSFPLRAINLSKLYQ